jgi:hypothetical protein
VYNTDTAASILAALGLPMPPDIEGKPVGEALARPARQPFGAAVPPLSPAQPWRGNWRQPP